MLRTTGALLAGVRVFGHSWSRGCACPAAPARRSGGPGGRPEFASSVKGRHAHSRWAALRAPCGARGSVVRRGLSHRPEGSGSLCLLPRLCRCGPLRRPAHPAPGIHPRPARAREVRRARGGRSGTCYLGSGAAHPPNRGAAAWSAPPAPWACQFLGPWGLHPSVRDQRGQLDRRPRRLSRWYLSGGFRRLGPLSCRSRGRSHGWLLLRVRRRVLWIPPAQPPPSSHLHGRHRIARPGGRAWSRRRALWVTFPTLSCLIGLRRRGGLRDAAGGLLQVHARTIRRGPPHFPHVALAPPFRAWRRARASRCPRFLGRRCRRGCCSLHSSKNLPLKETYTF